MYEVIKKVGNEIILYNHDATKVLQRFPFGEGQRYANEETARAAAEKRERQVQFFKHQGEAQLLALPLPQALRALRVLQEERKHHSAAWHDCWDAVKAKYDDRSAAAICTWSIQRPPNPPAVYEAGGQPAEGEEPKLSGVATLTLDDAWEIDEILAASMEAAGLQALKINLETWEIEDVPAEGETQKVSQEAVQAMFERRGFLEAGAKHTAAELAIIDKMIRYMQIIRDGEITTAEADELRSLGITVKATKEASLQEAVDLQARLDAIYDAWRTLYPWTAEGPNPPRIYQVFDDLGFAIIQDRGVYYRVAMAQDDAGAITFADRVSWVRVEQVWVPTMVQEADLSYGEKESRVRQAFDKLYGYGSAYRSESTQRVYPLDVFDGYLIVGDSSGSVTLYYQVGYTDSGDDITFDPPESWSKVERTWQPATQSQATQSEPTQSEETPATESAASVPLTEAAALGKDEAGNPVITGHILEGISTDDGSFPCVIIEAGKSKNNRRYRPEILEAAIPLFEGSQMYIDHPSRSEERDRPERSVRDLAARLWGVHWDEASQSLQGRAFISEAASWLKQLIKDKVAGDLSINASGKGRMGKDGVFEVEEITGGSTQEKPSVDFVTNAGARGRILAAIAENAPAGEGAMNWESLSVESLAEHRPELLNEIASREKDKLYRGKEEVLREAEAAPQLRDQLATSQKRIEELECQREAREVVDVVDQQLATSTLLLPSQSKIREQMQGVRLAEAPARVAQLIQEQKELAAAILEAGKVRGHGGSEPDSQAAAQEAHAAVVSGFERLGLPKEQAETAASRGRKK